MTKKYCHSLRTRHLPAMAPEHLLLLTIFGSEETQELVENELDRRAAHRPESVQATARTTLARAAA